VAFAVPTLELDYGPIKCYHIRQESIFVRPSIVVVHPDTGSLLSLQNCAKTQAQDFRTQEFFHHTFLSFKRTLFHCYGKAGVDTSTRRIGSPLFLLVKTEVDYK
jgi:hypothetical protein